MIGSLLHRLTPISASQEENPLWLVVLCDMMTNLMLFFLIMYGFTRQPEEARKKMMNDMANQFREQPQTAIEKKAEEVIQKVQEEDVGKILEQKKFAQVETTEERIRITLTNPVLFLSGEAALSAQAQKEIRELSLLLNALPNKILVEGHTDNQPIRLKKYASNWELSVARAASVVEFLARDCGVPLERFVLAGYGEHRPVSSNETTEGRMKNRRIEINILRKDA